MVSVGIYTLGGEILFIFIGGLRRKGGGGVLYRLFAMFCGGRGAMFAMFLSSVFTSFV